MSPAAFFDAAAAWALSPGFSRARTGSSTPAASTDDERTHDESEAS